MNHFDFFFLEIHVVSSLLKDLTQLHLGLILAIPALDSKSMKQVDTRKKYIERHEFVGLTLGS